MLSKLDNVLMAFCTKFSHWLQRTVGLSNFFLAKIGISITALGLLEQVLNYFHQFLVSKTSLVAVVLIGPYLMFLVWRTSVCSKAEERLLSDTKVLDPWLDSSIYSRTLWVCWLIIDCFGLHAKLKVTQYPFLEIYNQVSFSVGMIVYYFFIAVEPLSPGKSRLRKFVENLGFRSLVPAPAEN